MKNLLNKIIVFGLISFSCFGQGQGAYHDALMEEKNGSKGGNFIIGLIIVIAILYITSDKKER